MSIPSLDVDSAAGNEASPPVDPHDSALISRLLNEFYSGVAAPAKPPGHPLPPTTIAGSPTIASGVPAVPSPEIPLAAPTTELSPPVHPPNASSSGSKSGDAAPETPDFSADAYPFDDSHPDRSLLTNLFPADGRKASTQPEYYFLPGANLDGPLSLSGAAAPISQPGLTGLDVAGARADFPALHQHVNGRRLIWLDNAATTHKPQQVIDATSQFYSRDNSNIHRAAHTLAGRATELFEAGREKVRQFLGAADAKEIVFLRGTTEAINLVAQSYGRKHIGSGNEIIVSEMEHHANIVPWQLLARQTGAVVRVAPMNDRGELLVDEFAKLLGPRTKFVSITHVSNALGTINPIEQIIPLAHARGVPVLVDGAQSTPHIPLSVTALDADFYVFSAHKIFGPTGIGALYGKAHLLEEMPPWQGGGHMIRDVRFEETSFQQAPEKFEAGTPDIAGVVGLGAAIDYLTRLGMPAIAAYEHSLLEYATEALATVPGLRPIGTAASKASVLSFVIPGISPTLIANHLDKHGIAVRAGHHCAQPALRHFGLETTVRPSLAFYNTFEEVDALVKALYLLKKNP